MSAPIDRWGERLSRRLGLWSAVAVLVGSTIGSGIFPKVEGVDEVVERVGGANTVPDVEVEPVARAGDDRFDAYLVDARLPLPERVFDREPRHRGRRRIEGLEDERLQARAEVGPHDALAGRGPEDDANGLPDVLLTGRQCDGP
jgi:hypothetical protein